MARILGAVLMGAALWVPDVFAAEGFALDVDPRELRDRTEAWQLQDLAVGESGFIFGFQTCAVDERLHVHGNAILREKSGYTTSERVTVKPDRRVSIELLPAEKARGRLKMEDLGFLSNMRDCDNLALQWRIEAPLYRVDSINGHASLSALMEALAAPGKPAGTGMPGFDKSLSEMLGDVGKRDTAKDDRLPEWRVSESSSKIDDSPSVFMSIVAVEQVAARYGLQRPSMHVRCSENTTSVFFVVKDYFTDDRASVTYRLDAARAETIKMPVSTDNKAFGLWRGATAIPFMRQLFGKEWLVVKVTPKGSAARTFEFALGALEEKIKPLRKACHW